MTPGSTCHRQHNAFKFLGGNNVYEFRGGLGDVGGGGKKVFGVKGMDGFPRRMVVKEIEILHLVQG